MLLNSPPVPLVGRHLDSCKLRDSFTRERLITRIVGFKRLDHVIDGERILLGVSAPIQLTNKRKRIGFQLVTIDTALPGVDGERHDAKVAVALHRTALLGYDFALPPVVEVSFYRPRPRSFALYYAGLVPLWITLLCLLESETAFVGEIRDPALLVDVLV